MQNVTRGKLYPTLFNKFVGRDEALKNVKRFSLYPVMYYRSDLYQHSHHVAWLVREINHLAARVLPKNYDMRKAEIMAIVHDDAEIIFGDYQAGNKSKMSQIQLSAIKNQEYRAINELAAKFPKEVGGYNYKQLLTEMVEYSSLEAQIVCFADKYDALGESLHEIYAGNTVYVTPVVNEYGEIPLPTKYYQNYLNNFVVKFPDTKPLLDAAHALFVPVVDRDYRSIAESSQEHTSESVFRVTDDHHYDTWKNIILKYADEELTSALHTQREFPNSHA